jgi:hypothetical protein
MIRAIDSRSLGRMATLPFALFEWCFVFWYARTLGPFSRNTFTKLAAGAMFICVILGVVIGQLSAYLWVGHTKRLNDPSLMMVVLIESLVSAGVLFAVLIKRRQRGLK